MSGQLVTVERRDDIAVIRMQRPPVNAIDVAFLHALDAALDRVQQLGAHAAVLTGEGKCFSAGLDLKALSAGGAKARREIVLALNVSMTKLYAFPLPIVAAVNGHAIAGGLILTLACDYRVCTSDPVQIGLSESRVGVPFPVSALAIIETELRIGARRRLALVGNTVDARVALEWDAIDEMYPADALLQRALDVARDLATIPATSFTAIKLQLRDAALRRMRDAVARNDDPVLPAWDAADPALAAKRNG
jgi:enoyl-CoA hydratase